MKFHLTEILGVRIGISSLYLFKLENRALFPFVYTLSDSLKCFTITGQAEQTNDVDGESGQVEDRKELYSLQLKWKISSGIQPMTVI